MDLQGSYDLLNSQIKGLKRKIDKIEMSVQVIICALIILSIVSQSSEIKWSSIIADTIILLFYFKIMSKVRTHEISNFTKKFKSLSDRDKESISRYVKKKLCC